MPGTLSLPQTIGPYRLEAVLGQGGMGTVYRARLVTPRLGLDEGTLVALKVIHPALLAVPRFHERLAREARLGARVRHTNVVRTFGEETLGSGAGAGRALVMEYVEGQTLRALMEEVGRVPEALARTIALALAEGLAAIHDAGAVHRDLKPENVLFTTQNQVKIMDLGVAHLQDATMALSQADAFTGSIDYAAPEQFPGAVGPPDGRSDLFALGIVLHEMVVGEHPFRGEGTRPVLRAILHDHPVKAGELNPQVSPFLEEVISTLLAKQPDSRFASARLLAQALREGESGAWWTDRAQILRQTLGRSLRRIQVPHDTTVVGRESELRVLWEAFDRVRAGSGQVVLLRGEAGVGKTRLAEEFVRRLVQDGKDVDFLAGAYPLGGTATVHGAFSTAFRERLGAENVADALGDLCSRDWYLIPALGALLTGEPRPKGAAPLDRRTLCTAFARVTAALSKTRPVVLLIDDLHQAPEVGRTLFGDLARAIGDQAVLLIGCGRRRLPAAWVAEIATLPQAHQLELERLGPQALHRLLRSTLGASQVVRDLEPLITLKSEGNPYFVLEILRSLKERGRLRRAANGEWMAVGRTDVLEVPSSLHDLIDARLAGLGELERELLEVGACCGFVFDPLLVAEVAGADRIVALRALGRIEASHRLVHDRGQTYVFDHHQVLEVLYAGLSPMLREEYHGAISAAMTRRLNDLGGESAPGALAVEICRHGLRSSDPAVVRPHITSALAHLQDEHQIAEALSLVSDVLERHGLVELEHHVRLLLKKNHLLGVAGDRPAQQRVLEEADSIADEVEQDGIRFELAIAHAYLAFHQGRLEEAQRHFTRARVLARASGTTTHESQAEGGLGLVAYRAGQLEDARTHFEQNHVLAEEASAHAIALAALGNLGIVLQAMGRSSDALACAERVMAEARAAGELRIEGKCCANLGILLQDLGRVEEARAHYARSVEIADRVGDRMSQAVGRVNLGAVLREQDRLAEAQSCLRDALKIGMEIRDPINQAIGLDNLGVVALFLGEHEEARERFDAALKLCHEVGSTRDASYVLENQARLAEDEGRLEDAIRLLEDAIALRRESRDPVGEASALAMLGRVCGEQGEVDRAGECLGRALEITDEHAAPTVSLRTLAELAILRRCDADRLRSALEKYAGQAVRDDELRAWFALWRVTGDQAALTASRRLLAERVAHAPAASRVTMQQHVPLHRAIAEAEVAGDPGPR